MKLSLENVKTEHYKLLVELAKVLGFKIVEVELSEDEEEATLLAAIEAVKDEPNATKEEVEAFEV